MQGGRTFSLSPLGPSYVHWRAESKVSFCRFVLYLHFTVKGLSGTLDPEGLEKAEGPLVISAQ
jgi:hypothetical protein